MSKSEKSTTLYWTFHNLFTKSHKILIVRQGEIFVLKYLHLVSFYAINIKFAMLIYSTYLYRFFSIFFRYFSYQVMIIHSSLLINNIMHFFISRYLSRSCQNSNFNICYLIVHHFRKKL